MGSTSPECALGLCSCVSYGGVEGGIRVEDSFLHVPYLLQILKNVLYVQQMSVSLAIDHFYGRVVALRIHTGLSKKILGGALS